MIQVENQHWLPKFLIKNFADSDGKVYRLNIADDRVSKPPPKHAAARPNFNELLVHGHPKSFEQRFEQLETAAAPVIANIVKTQSLREISESQRGAIAEFIAAQTFRTEAYRLGLGVHGNRYDVGEVTELLISDVDPLAKLIERRRWALMVTTGDMQFYLGDNPVVLQNTEYPGQAGELGLDMVGVEAFMPLAPNCALYMPCPTIGSDIVTGYWDALRIVTAGLAQVELNDFDVERALPIARRTLGNAESLYRALSHGEAFLADNKNVENLNYLQCAWSSSGIYSKRPDFSFALRVFRENPGYRKTMPVSIKRIF